MGEYLNRTEACPVLPIRSASSLTSAPRSRRAWPILAAMLGCLAASPAIAAPDTHETATSRAAIASNTGDGSLPFGWRASAPLVATQIEQMRHELDGIRAVLAQPDANISTDLAGRLSARAQSCEQAARNLTTQLQSYQGVYQGFADVLGKTAIPGEDPSLTRQRAAVTAVLGEINSNLTQARLASLEAHQLGLGIARQTANQHQALISQRAPSPLSPLFWQQIRSETRQDRAVARTLPALSHTDGIATSRWVGPLVLAALLAATLLAAGATRAPLGRLLGRLTAMLHVTPTDQDPPLLPWAFLNGLTGSLVAWLLGLGVSAALGLNEASPFWPAAGALMPLWPTCGLVAGVGAVLSRRVARGATAPADAPVADGAPPWPRGLALWLCLAILAQGVLRFLDHESAIGLFTLELLQSLFSLVVVWSAQRTAMRLPGGPPVDTSSNTALVAAGGMPTPVAEARFLPPLRATCTIWAAIVTISVLLGYLSFAYALSSWVLSVATGLGLTLLAAASLRLACDAVLSPQGRLAQRVRKLGISSRLLQQAGVLISGVGNLLLIAVLVSIALAQGEMDPTSVLDNLRGLFTGRTIGGVSVSLDTVLKCALILLLGRYAIALLADWLRNRLFPTTRLDIGAQTSALSIFTYAAWIGLLLTVLSIAGLTIQNLAWIMSALSVGIGFGLQAIVQNFVSGIILLAERPVRIGDQVEIGGKTGDIRRISVRSTELRLADGSVLIVPNSQFITSAVRNATLGNAQAQITILFAVPPDSDMERIRGLLLGALDGRQDVLTQPAPSITVTALSDTALTIALSLQIASSRVGGSVRSGVVIDAHRAFAAAGIALATAEA